MPAYDETLARGILAALDEAFPTKVSLRDLKAHLPDFATLADEEWFLAIDALDKMGFVDGIFSRPGFNKVLRGVANLEITMSGREHLGHMLVEVADSLRSESEDVDYLTQLYTKERFDRDLAGSCTEASSARPLALLVIDLDYFKRVNDTRGHDAGDEVLKQAASLVKAACEGKGSCYRWGGDEVAVLLPNYSLVEAKVLAERIRAVFSEARFGDNDERMTVSVGVACVPETTQKCEDLFADADRALYRAKEAGRNAVRVASG
jgi:diguanylate cyclase (GGDEF)-like protein